MGAVALSPRAGLSMGEPATPGDRRFGRHVRSLRRARGLTQERLAEQSDLSPDTIRRLEHGSFSPSLNTLWKLADGLDLLLGTLFSGYELGESEPLRELGDLLGRRSARDVRLGIGLLRILFAELDALKNKNADDTE